MMTIMRIFPPSHRYTSTEISNKNTINTIKTSIVWNYIIYFKKKKKIFIDIIINNYILYFNK